MTDITPEAAQIIFDLWREYTDMADDPNSQVDNDCWNAGERACGVAAALTRLGYRIKTQYTLEKNDG